MLSGNPSTARNRYPFTANQWQELEHQALIFKYMASGVPIPGELVYSFKRRLDSSICSRLFPHHPLGWGCFEMGFGRKIDPEPGRCRRTDGKKWRCSKEAYPDSKYCERHMHRGRNRSRKPVEVSSSSSSPTPTPTATAEYPSPPPAISSSTPKTLSPLASSSALSSETQPQHEHHHHHLLPHQSNSSLYPFLNYPLSSFSSTSRPHPVSLFSPQISAANNPTPQLFLNSGSYNNQAEKDYRFVHGAKEGMDELAFFPQSSTNARSLMGSYRGGGGGYPHQSQFQSLTDHNNIAEQSQEEEEEQHCYVWGTDFKSSREIKREREAAESTQKSLHHFFGDWQQPPQKSTDSWLDLASNSGVPNDG